MCFSHSCSKLDFFLTECTVYTSRSESEQGVGPGSEEWRLHPSPSHLMDPDGISVRAGVVGVVGSRASRLNSAGGL